MTARDCLKGKIAIGRVSKAAGARILRIIEDAQRDARADDETAMHGAMAQALSIAKAEAARKEAVASGNIVAQANVLRAQKAYAENIAIKRASQGVFGFGNQAPPGLGGAQSSLGKAMNSLIARDIWDGAPWANVYYSGVTLRKEAMSSFAQAVEYLRPKKLGLAPETVREEDVLGALYGRDAAPEAKAAAQAFTDIIEKQRQQFNEAAGYEAIPFRKDYRIHNPVMDPAKVQAWTPEDFVRRVTPLLDRDRMIDFATGQRMSDAKLESVLRDVHETGRLDGAEGQPNAGYVGEGPLSARRAAQRTLILKDPESWQQFRDLFGTNTSTFDAMTRHISAMAHDTAIMRVLGPDPASTKRFILSLFDREAAGNARTGDPADAKAMAEAVKANRQMQASVESGRKSFENLWAHMTGEAGIPVNAELAKRYGDVRHVLMSSQLGTSIFAAMTDIGLVGNTARFNGLPVLGTIGRALKMMGEPGAEVTAMQAGVVSDSIAHGIGATDRYMGETIRAGTAAKMSNAVLRGIGHRRWTSIIRSAFGMEFQARMATHADRGTLFAELPFRQSLERYGIDEAGWNAAAQAFRDGAVWEPRPGARFLRPMDLKGDNLTQTGPALARMIATEIDYTAIEGDPLARAAMAGFAGRSGTHAGELLRGGMMYKSWPVTVVLTHGARALANGWDGSRLAHGALSFALMTIMGVLAMQAKEITAGRDPLSLDVRTAEGVKGWQKAMLQGGGFGIFGDVVFADKTKFGDSWAATLGGPFVDLAERVGGGVVKRNIQLAAEGRPTNFFGDALHIGARYVPGSNVWYWRAAFDHAVKQQLELMIDPRASERLARVEEVARREFHQDYWYRPRDAVPARAPNLGAMFGTQ